jgi:DNA polymerase III delta prime subunit
MASELGSLIVHLKQYEAVPSECRPRALHFINNYSRFLTALQAVDEMVGLDIAKEQIAQQIKTFTVNYRRFGKPTNREMLHTLIYGPPGCGKTQLGQHLAEIWASSGCLPSEDSSDIFSSNGGHDSNKKVDLPPLKDTNTYDNEKVTLRQNLALRDSHLKQYQEKINQDTKAIKTVLTRINNTRKKIKAKETEKETRIQAQFQEIKHYLKCCLQNQSSPSCNTDDNHHKILPVSIPTIPGTKSFFGNSQPPLSDHKLPSVSSDTHSLLTNASSTSENSLSKPAKFIRITRGDLIGKYQGHTTDQVRKMILKHIGGVVMIDEAYDICTSTQDSFGKEALTEIINFMTTWPDKIIFIFAGYRDKMEESVLTFQPGLARRFNWTFEIADYSAEELAEIFERQINTLFGTSTDSQSTDQMNISPETMKEVKEFFKTHHSKFPFYGGDTERLCTSLKEVINSQHWERALDDTIEDEEYNKSFTEVTLDDIKRAYNKYLENSVKLKEDQKKKEEEEKSRRHVRHMYC